MNLAFRHDLAQRHRRLAAMGIVRYRLRTSSLSGTDGTSADNRVPGSDQVRTGASVVSLVVVCAQSVPEKVRESILRALGIEAQLVSWVGTDQESVSTVPKNAENYLLLGPELARSVGAELPTGTQRSATVVVTDAPSHWRTDALGKRLFWQALRPLVRALRLQQG